jgi:hypothetical protein
MHVIKGLDSWSVFLETTFKKGTSLHILKNVMVDSGCPSLNDPFLCLCCDTRNVAGDREWSLNLANIFLKENIPIHA